MTVATRSERICGKPRPRGVGEAQALLCGHRSTLERRAHDGRRIVHHRIGEVGVLERGLRVGMPEHAADYEHALALFQGERGIAEVVNAHVLKVCPLADAPPRRLRADFEPIGLRVEQLTAAVEVDAFEEELLADGEEPFDIFVATPEKLSGVSSEDAVLMRMNAAPRSAAEALGSLYREVRGGDDRRYSVGEARRFLKGLGADEWDGVRSEGTALSGTGYKRVWEVPSGEAG